PPHRRGRVNQREVGADTTTFAPALKHALRQDPDIILVGELRDLETVSTALTAAETGHLVLATLHTQSAAQTIDRVIDIYPPHQQQQIRAQLSMALQGVVTQALAPRADGTGRTIITEILCSTPAITEQSAIGLRKELSIPGLTGRTTLKDLSVFSRQFATLSNSGMSLLRSLAVLEDQAAKPGLRRAVGEVRTDIEGGLSLSAAM